MKKIIAVTLLFTIQQMISQEEHQSRWTTSAHVDLLYNKSNNYRYYDDMDKLRHTNIKKTGAIALSYDLDYRFFKRLSVSVSTGYNVFITPGMSTLKFGGGFKYKTNVDNKGYFTIQYAYHQPFNKKKFREGHEIKIAQYFDAYETNGHHILVGLLYNYDFFYLEGATKLPNNATRAFSLDYVHYGLSLAMVF